MPFASNTEKTNSRIEDNRNRHFKNTLPHVYVKPDRVIVVITVPDGTSRKEHYLPKGEREPETAYRKRLDAASPSGFFCDALRTYAGMLSRGSWISLPARLSSVLTDVDGRGTELGVFLAAADLLVLRDGAALVLVVPPEHSWPGERDR